MSSTSDADDHNEVALGIVDVETTGLFPFRHDRVVEVAAVVLGADGAVVREFVSLVNPERDIGPSHIHGLLSADILDAPKFQDVAPQLVSTLEGTVAIAAHNVRFDQQFLACEFSRLGQAWPDCHRLCTMEMAGGGRLASCCTRYGTDFDGDAHCALFDARATAQLLVRLLANSPNVVQELTQLRPIRWPVFPPPAHPPLTRDASRRRQDQPPIYLRRLLHAMPSESLSPDLHSAELAYIALLDRVLEDRRIEDPEAEALLEMATHWGMSRRQVQHVHRWYLDRLAVAALVDGVVTDAERRDLESVCRLLGHPSADLDPILDDAAASVSDADADTSLALPAGESLVGKRVCFTGEMACSYRGELITRELAEQLARSAGLEVIGHVSKKLDILVVADPNTQSGKAKKAREYGIRVLHEPVFWSTIGINVE